MNPELSSIWSREAELEQLIEDLASQAIARKTLGTDEAEHLVRTFNAVPPAEASGLGVEDHSRFVSTNLQLVEICLQEPGLHRPGFVNPLLQQELDRCRLRSGGRVLVAGTHHRRGATRHRSQVHLRPGEVPSR